MSVATLPRRDPAPPTRTGSAPAGPLRCPDCGAPLFLHLDAGPDRLGWLCDCVLFVPADVDDADES